MFDVPRSEGLCDPGPEARRTTEAEARVVREPEVGERREVRVRIDAQVVEALPVERRAEALELRLLVRDQTGLEGSLKLACRPTSAPNPSSVSTTRGRTRS